MCATSTCLNWRGALEKMGQTMPWKNRGNRWYFYRQYTNAGQRQCIYLGRGPGAVLAAEAEAAERRQVRLEKAERQQTRLRLVPIEQGLR